MTHLTETEYKGTFGFPHYWGSLEAIEQEYPVLKLKYDGIQIRYNELKQELVIFKRFEDTYYLVAKKGNMTLDRMKEVDPSVWVEFTKQTQLQNAERIREEADRLQKVAQRFEEIWK